MLALNIFVFYTTKQLVDMSVSQLLKTINLFLCRRLPHPTDLITDDEALTRLTVDMPCDDGDDVTDDATPDVTTEQVK
jgi:hypothetical protein